MRLALLLAVAALSNAAVLSRDWANGKLDLTLDDGHAEIEWLSPVAFRVSRVWGGDPLPKLPEISHEKIGPEFTDVGETLTMRTRYITLTVNRADMSMHVVAGETPVANHLLVRTNDAVELRLNFAPSEHVFGNSLISTEVMKAIPGLFFTSAGYGVYVRAPGVVLNVPGGTVRAQRAKSIDYCFYYGPTPKEIFEQHALVIGADEVKSASLDLLAREQLPRQATALKNEPNASDGDALGRLVGGLISATLSGVIYPAIDVADFDYMRSRESGKHILDLCTLLPVVFRSSGEGGIDAATRARWRPYLITYLREAYDRGYPLIRPLPMQFWRDANSNADFVKQTDVFMLGDELLLAPALLNKRKLTLPRGNWTDLRTNIEYKGNSTIEVDSPPGQVPMFVRNGWIVPQEFSNRMELHYFPSLGAEFFLWEPDIAENSQFHAAPAGDYTRVEIESKVARIYEWILHHTKAPREVAEESGALTRVDKRDQLKPGAWWHDAAQNNLHLMVRAEAGKDLIINMQ